jgi:hypothetical protein
MYPFQIQSRLQWEGDSVLLTRVIDVESISTICAAGSGTEKGGHHRKCQNATMILYVVLQRL